MDSPLEEGGFEPLVPLSFHATNAGEHYEKIAMRCAVLRYKGTAIPVLTCPVRWDPVFESAFL
jgi:hypothetical protein